MDIKEIALKHAREYLTFKLGGRKGLDVEEIVCDDEIYKEIVNELAQQFEALVAEIAKQNGPVVSQYKGSDGSWKSFDSKDHESNTRNSGDWEVRDLFTFPPTAEQIANETSEAIAKFVAFQRNDIPATGIEFAEVIRNGAWKDFKK